MFLETWRVFFSFLPLLHASGLLFFTGLKPRAQDRCFTGLKPRAQESSVPSASALGTFGFQWEALEVHSAIDVDGLPCDGFGIG